MDNVDDSENNAKISDSGYSASCSNNSQSRRSRSSKSTHYGSNSSHSSGYGGQPSTGSSNDLGKPSERRNKDKELKKKKQKETETIVQDVNPELECHTLLPENNNDLPTEEQPIHDVVSNHSLIEKVGENMDISTSDANSVKEVVTGNTRPPSSLNLVSNKTSPDLSDNFSCVISMQDGVVMYITPTLTPCLGFPKDMWIGRSFIDFIHPKDRNMFTSQITSGVAAPKDTNDNQEKVQPLDSPVSTMFCRIRRYRGLSLGFGVKDKSVLYSPFFLKLSFKNITDEEGKLIYLVMHASLIFSAFKTANDTDLKNIPFVIRHIANGNLEYVGPESVQYLGYLPQDIIDTDILQLYHPDDLNYLQQVYQTIVKKGGTPRCKPYRMLAQNGHYLKLETEWSSFINPWSRKLEFVIGKHHVIEGPVNPDVFQPPEVSKLCLVSEEDKLSAQVSRKNIIRIMNEVLTKPAEVAKQQMNRRCQELATFMESLVEEQPKPDEELQLEIHEPDNTYYERDSVMLGGISPHHEYNDGKSSTETYLSYTQLNYNETLQRYFNSHQAFTHYEDSNTMGGENVINLKIPKASGTRLSPVAQNSGDSYEMTSSCESSAMILCGSNSSTPSLGEYHHLRLTESLLIKHNSEMEKDLVVQHREMKFSGKGKQDKPSFGPRKKRGKRGKRSSSVLQAVPPTATTDSQLNSSNCVKWVLPRGTSKRKRHHVDVRNQHGVKRTSRHLGGERRANKHHKSNQQVGNNQATSAATSSKLTTAVTTTVATSNWPIPSAHNMGTFIGMPQQISVMNPMAGMTDMFPMYYVPTAGINMPENNANQELHNSSGHFTEPTMQYMMYGQPIFGSSIVYSPMSAQMPFAMQQSLMAQNFQYNATRPLGLTTNNYEEAFKRSSHHNVSASVSKCSQATSLKIEERSGADGSISFSSEVNQSTTVTPTASVSRESKTMGLGNSEEPRTDGESSYSSFYSSFFKTESGSAEDSDTKKSNNTQKGKSKNTTLSKDWPKRKMEPPWMEQVCVTSDLVYKYQIAPKSAAEVLSADKEKLTKLEQPSMVNEQLGQLYDDLQLDGVAARLTLEEGITSSDSSGEECSNTKPSTVLKKDNRKKREYSKLVMIYEENAPIPPPPVSEPSVSL